MTRPTQSPLGPRHVLLRRISTTLLAVAVLGGCSNRQVRIQMRAGEGGPERVFETNRANGDEVGRLAEAYEIGPSQRAKGEDGVRFEASFADRELPSEVGNRNGWSSIQGPFGTAYLYIEQFGDGRDDWDAFRSRMDAGRLWIELAVGFFEGRIEDEDARAEWRRFADEELVPDLMSAFLRFTANGFVQQGQRVDYSFRAPSARGPRTDDEWFQIQVFTPLIGFAVERGWISAEEGQLVLLSGLDGWVSAGEREWSRTQLADPIIERSVQRFVPGAKPGRIGPENDDLILMGLSFLWWVNTSDGAVQVLLASPAIEEEQKAKLRAGNRFIDIPGPFGIPIGGGARPLESEVVLETGAEPFVTNGNWDESLGTVTFGTKLYPPEQRRRMAPPVFHASWAVPARDVQSEIFGEVVLVGRDLAEVVFWERTLDDDDRKAWADAVTKARTSGDLSAMSRLVDSVEGEGKGDRPAPLKLRSLLIDGPDGGIEP
ncbi:MAG: hypothetical protein GY895_19830 [Phycisphaera sp.]|nr:hypothetical protein [Phycisphaera sp.]